MKCEEARPRLTAYLDGELEDDRGSAVRGHLRECVPCREIAADEATLRDALRELPVLDPPPSVWAGVQARLAEAEVADARRPAWRRALRRWTPSAPRLAMGGALAAAAVLIVWWRTPRPTESPPVNDPPGAQVVAPAPPTPHVVGPAQVELGTSHGDELDVTAELEAEAARVTSSYGDVAEELLALVGEVRGQWPVARQDAFDAQVAELRGEIDRSDEGRPRQRAWRTLVRYLQRAVVRDEITLASSGVSP